MPRGNIKKAGGILLAVKRGLNARSFAHLVSDVSQCYGASDGGKKELDFSAMSIRTSWQQIAAVQIYLDHGVGIRGRSLRTLRTLG
eukprot:2572149-Pyramimonas_sp.AAC.1